MKSSDISRSRLLAFTIIAALPLAQACDDEASPVAADDEVDVVETTDTSGGETGPGDTGDTDAPTDTNAPTDTVVTDVADTIDTNTPPDTTDTSPEPADATDATDTALLDTTDTTEVEVTPECVDDARCEALLGGDACNEARCIDGACTLVAATDGAPCSDGDRCSTGDKCRAGVCEPGDGVLVCPALSAADACFVPTCSPGSGCGKVPAAEGTPCDNGAGPEPGSCQAGGYQQPDACDGRGTCVDAIELVGDPTEPALEGDWFAVSTTFGRYAAPATARALRDVAAGSNTLVVKAARAVGASPFWDGAEGHFCTGDDGTLEGHLAGGTMLGHQLDERLAVVADPASDGITMLLRADLGSSTQVSGRYRYFQTTVVFGASTPTTWRGTVEFSSGCLTSGAIATDPAVAGQYDFAPLPAGDCLVASSTGGEVGLFRLATHSRAHTGDPTSWPIDFRGAIGEGGDILLMVKEQHLDAPSTTPEYGIVILVREPGAGALTESGLAGTWAFDQHTRLGGDLPRRDMGTLTWAANGIVGAGAVVTLEGQKPLAGGWFDFDAAPRKLSQRLTIGGLDTFYAGAVDRTGRFIVGWTVTAPAKPGVASVLGDVPRYGSMLLMLKLGD